MGRIAHWSEPITPEEEERYRREHKLGPNTQIYKVGKNSAEAVFCGGAGSIRQVFIDSDAEAYCIKHLGRDFRDTWPFVHFNGETAVEDAKEFVAWAQFDEYASKNGLRPRVKGTDGVTRIVDADGNDELLEQFRAKHGLPPRPQPEKKGD